MHTCHTKIDPFGFALENYDAIGRKRDKDLGDRPIDTASDLPDGTHIDGLADLRSYLLAQRKDQFCANSAANCWATLWGVAGNCRMSPWSTRWSRS